jgi:phage gp29-like protein
MLKMYERRIARAVLGSVLAIFEAEFGTRAQAETHLEMLKKVISSYQKDIEGPVNAQLVKPVLRYNVGDADVVWHLNAPAFADLQKLGAWIADLAQAGVIDPVRDANSIRGMFNMDPLNQEDLEAVSSDASGSSKA